MRRPLRRALLLLVALGAGACAHAPAAAPPPPQGFFELHSSFWVNVHQALIIQGMPWRGRTNFAPPPAAAASPGWQESVAWYRSSFGDRRLFDDDGLAAINLALAQAGDVSTLPPSPAVSADLAAALERAAKEYRAEWPAQDAMNREWIRRAQALVDRHGTAMARELASLLRSPWPTAPIRVEVSRYAGPVGAYTMGPPTLTTVSSTDPGYQGDASLEMLFHEASHALIDPVQQGLEAECRALHKDPRDAWHAVLFYTAGEVARRELGPAYVPYPEKNGLWASPHWRDLKPLLDQHWLPYLQGKARFEDVLRALATALPP